MKKEFDQKEKDIILDIVKTWKRDQVTFETFRTIQSEFGVPARLVETVFWLEDTLDVIQPLGHLVLKGGTGVQSYIPPMEQRASVDLDFNTDIQNPNAIMAHIRTINSAIEKYGRSCKVRGIFYGMLEFDYKDEYSGTLNFRRRMPSRFGEFERVGDVKVQSKSIRVQINYKHSWLPAEKVVEKEPAFFINQAQRPQTSIRIRHESIEDLFAEKVLAVCNVGPFGRERFKDIYDLLVMMELPEDELVVKKVKTVAKKSRVSMDAIFDGALRTISSSADKSAEVRGFSSIVCKIGKSRIERWEMECERLKHRMNDLREVETPRKSQRPNPRRQPKLKDDMKGETETLA